MTTLVCPTKITKYVRGITYCIERIQYRPSLIQPAIKEIRTLDSRKELKFFHKWPPQGDFKWLPIFLFIDWELHSVGLDFWSHIYILHLALTRWALGTKNDSMLHGQRSSKTKCGMNFTNVFLFYQTGVVKL